MVRPEHSGILSIPQHTHEPAPAVFQASRPGGRSSCPDPRAFQASGRVSMLFQHCPLDTHTLRG
eukprot:10508882-Alexandrium_andersonii.AAC.1